MKTTTFQLLKSNIKIRSQLEMAQTYRERYTHEFFDQLMLKLEATPSRRPTIEETVLIAAYQFVTDEDYNESIDPNYIATKRLKRLIKSLNISIDELNAIHEAPIETLNNFLCELDDLYENKRHIEFFDYLHSSRCNDEDFIQAQYNTKKLKQPLEIYLEAAQNALTEYTQSAPTNKRNALGNWIKNIKPIFEDSPITFTAGKHYGKENGFISECVFTLEELIQKIDPTITKDQIAYKILSQ